MWIKIASAVCGLAVLVGGMPALALPGLDLSGGLYLSYAVLRPAGASPVGADLDAFVGTIPLKLSGHLFALGQNSGVGEIVARWEPIPLPFVTLRPGLGYQGNTLFSQLPGASILPQQTPQVVGASAVAPGTLDHAPYGSILASVELPLLPITADAEVGASYPLALRQPVLSYMANLSLSPLPLVPLAISARYRAYSIGVTSAPGAAALELGLRIKL